MDKNTQCNQVLQYMRENGAITPLEAVNFGCMRLSARICDLRKRGYQISKTTIKSLNRAGIETRFASYSLFEDES